MLVLVCWKNGVHVHLIIFERHTVAHHDQTFNIRMISDIMILVQLAIKKYINKKGGGGREYRRMEERTELDHDNLTELTFTVDGWLELSSGVPSASLTIGSKRRVKRRAMPRDTIVSQDQEEWLEESDGTGEESDGTGEERVTGLVRRVTGLVRRATELVRRVTGLVRRVTGLVRRVTGLVRRVTGLVRRE